jgi:hypothetical protein
MSCGKLTQDHADSIQLSMANWMARAALAGIDRQHEVAACDQRWMKSELTRML